MRAYSACRMNPKASVRIRSTSARSRFNRSYGSSSIAGGASLDIGELLQDVRGQDWPDHVKHAVDHDLCGDGVHRRAPLSVRSSGRGGWCRRVVPRRERQTAAGAAFVSRGGEIRPPKNTTHPVPVRGLEPRECPYRRVFFVPTSMVFPRLLPATVVGGSCLSAPNGHRNLSHMLTLVSSPTGRRPIYAS